MTLRHHVNLGYVGTYTVHDMKFTFESGHAAKYTRFQTFCLLSWNLTYSPWQDNKLREYGDKYKQYTINNLFVTVSK